MKVSNPDDPDIQNELRFIFSRSVILEAYPEEAILKAISRYYQVNAAAQIPIEQNDIEFRAVEKNEEQQEAIQLRQEVDEISVVQRSIKLLPVQSGGKPVTFMPNLMNGIFVFDFVQDPNIIMVGEIRDLENR